MALTQGSSVAWSDIRNLFDRVNAQRHRFLNEAEGNRKISPTQGSIVYASTPNNLKTWTGEIISGNTFARTALASTLTNINSISAVSVGGLLYATPLSQLASYLSTIEAYNPSITTGTANRFSAFNFNSAFGAANGTFFSAFTAVHGTFFARFTSAHGTFFARFGRHNGTHFDAFGASHSTVKTGGFHSSFNSSFTTGFGTFFSSFTSVNGTHFGTFHASGFFSRFGSSNGRFHTSSFCATVYRSFTGACSFTTNTTVKSGHHATYFSAFSSRNTTVHSGKHTTFFSQFGSRRTTVFNSFGASHGTFHGTFFSGFNARFTSAHGTFFDAFSAANGTHFDAFGAANTTFFARFTAGCPSAFYADFTYSFSSFNAAFCPAEFCTSFNAASFFRSLPS